MSENNQNQNNQSQSNQNQDNLMDLFARAVTLQRRYLRHRLRSYQGDPYRGQSRVLSILKLKPRLSQKELGYLLDMRSQSLGELLVKLERAGYVTRAASEEDRRVMMIQLTDLGLAAAEQAEATKADGGLLFDCFSAEEQENLSEYLKRLILRMEQETADAPPAGCDFEYDPFWGVGKAFKEDSRALRRHLRAHGRALRDELRGQARDLRDELRGDPRLKGFFWGPGDWDGRLDPDDHSPGNGQPR